jgi:hypothetical protein
MGEGRYTMTTIATPDLAARQRAVAQLLSNTGYHARRVSTVISDKPLPACEWCVYEPQPANCELIHDQGSVLSCRGCLLTAASGAAEDSGRGEFSMEITERAARREYIAEVGLDHGYGAYVMPDGGEWARYYVDLDALGDGAA